MAGEEAKRWRESSQSMTGVSWAEHWPARGRHPRATAQPATGSVVLDLNPLSFIPSQALHPHYKHLSSARDGSGMEKTVKNQPHEVPDLMSLHPEGDKRVFICNCSLNNNSKNNQLPFIPRPCVIKLQALTKGST